MIQPARSGTLPVPGAELHYKLLGTGLHLVLPQDADASDGLAGRLADAFTIVTYDRRGMERSPLTTPEMPLHMETESADVVRLICGTPATMAEFAARLGVNSRGGEHLSDAVQPNSRSHLNEANFLGREQDMIRRYRLELGDLPRVARQIVVAVGRGSRDLWPARSAAALANLVAAPLVEFPGDHAGYARQPEQFAARLRDVLGR